MTAAALDGRVMAIRIDLLDAASFNPRKTFDEASLRELAASIREQGIITPLLVRPVETEGLEGRFEIVSGHRRAEAATSAGLFDVPCLVRILSDDKAREEAITDNLQRVEVPVVEEAEGFAALAALPGSTIETVAAKVGKSASYVGRRLSLLSAIDPVREALRAGAIEVGHAMELARLSDENQLMFLLRMDTGFDPDLQDALAEGDEVDPQEWRFTGISVAELRRRIANGTRVNLADAPFPLVDPALDPFDCQACAKRSGNAQLLFDDCGQDQCTDRACFESKTTQWIEHSIEKHGKKPALQRLSCSYSSDKKVLRGHVFRRVEAGDECASAEAGIWMDGALRGQAQRFCRDPKCKTHHPQTAAATAANATGGKKSPEAKQKVVAEKAAQVSAVKTEEAYRRRLFDGIAKTPESVLQSIGNRLVVDILAEDFTEAGEERFIGEVARAMGIDPQGLEVQDKVSARFGEMSFGAIAVALLLLRSADELEAHPWNMREGRKLGLEMLAGKVGLDPKDFRDAEPKKKPEPKTLKPAAKKASTKPTAKKSLAKPVKPVKQALAKKPVAKPVKPAKKPAKPMALDAASRKRIANAAKKRWAGQKKGGAK